MVVFQKLKEYGEYLEDEIENLPEIKQVDIRGILDNRDEKIGRKIRGAEVKKIPYMIILGDKEKANRNMAEHFKKNRISGIIFSFFFGK